jgi:hypothetical protein
MNDSVRYIIDALRKRVAEIAPRTRLSSDFEQYNLHTRQMMLEGQERAMKELVRYEKMLGDWESGRSKLPVVDIANVESVLVFLGSLPRDENIARKVRLDHGVTPEVVHHALDNAPVGTTLYFSGAKTRPRTILLTTRIWVPAPEGGDLMLRWQSEAILGTPARFWSGFHMIDYTVELPDPVSGAPRPRPAEMDREESERVYNVFW